MEILELIRVDFSTFENYSPAYRTTLGMFSANKELHTSAHGTLSKFLEDLPPVKLYTGWDGEVYPKFRIKTHIVNI